MGARGHGITHKKQCSCPGGGAQERAQGQRKDAVGPQSCLPWSRRELAAQEVDVSLDAVS